MDGRCASAEATGEATWGVATIKDREVGARFLWEVLQGKVEVITKRKGDKREKAVWSTRAIHHVTCYQYGNLPLLVHYPRKALIKTES